MNLSNLSPYPGSTKQRKRIGRGQGTGQGKQSGKGHKGYKARSGSSISPGFEGGQMPLHRRLPKRGFTNPFKKEYGIVNVKDLEVFDDNTLIDSQLLHTKGLVGKKYTLIKLLGTGEITKKLIVKLSSVSESAKLKIESAGGKIEV
ncbi:MAG: 50S ribosomal protein L15 [Proteobacteria bacterium]|nr:50S ribosomal protein L15 [Desulfobulbaceae bacterium]MBU4154445.1 50S ribosomal protein L15 [Pseudomonadota bacterium]MDP2107296.1 50S ribosomal protein L15 [Desulfobulbaceae bacterium]